MCNVEESPNTLLTALLKAQHYAHCRADKVEKALSPLNGKALESLCAKCDERQARNTERELFCCTVSSKFTLAVTKQLCQHVMLT